jgi:hypothetical protein
MIGSLLVRPSVSDRLTSLATYLCLSIFAVYTYRDVWPLATFTLSPQDVPTEGALLWLKYAAATLAGVLLPLTVPRRYMPVDPAHPSAEPAPEQTASWLSLALYAFLDPLVLRTTSAAQLAEAQLPPLLDTDAARVLAAQAFPILDTFSGARRAHVGLGLVRVFRREFLVLCGLTVLKVASNFASPLGINRLLAYLETGGAGAVVRPWVWAAWLFLGPLLGSVAMQAYIFLNTRTLVRTEALLTQLVFAHALRVRLKADAPPGGGTAPPTRAASPTASEPTSEAPTVTEGQVDLGKGNSRAAATESAGTTATVGATANVAQASAAAAAEADEGAGGASLVGRINNLVTVDLNNIVDGRDFLMLILWAPLELALSMWFLYYFLGWASLVGLAVMCALLPIPGLIAKRIQTVQEESMKKVCLFDDLVRRSD